MERSRDLGKDETPSLLSMSKNSLLYSDCTNLSQPLRSVVPQ